MARRLVADLGVRCAVCVWLRCASAQVRELWIEGDAQVGGLLVAKSYYFGGVQGDSEFWWMRIDSEGERTDITEPTMCDVTKPLPDPNSPAGDADVDPRVHRVTEADLGCCIKVVCRPRRADGETVRVCVCLCGRVRLVGWVGVSLPHAHWAIPCRAIQPRRARPVLSSPHRKGVLLLLPLPPLLPPLQRVTRRPQKGPQATPMPQLMPPQPLQHRRRRQWLPRHLLQCPPHQLRRLRPMALRQWMAPRTVRMPRCLQTTSTWTPVHDMLCGRIV